MIEPRGAMMIKMHGNMNEVLTDGTHVYRKKNEFSRTICQFLIHLNEHGYPYAPQYVGEDEDNYILEFIEGDDLNLDSIDGPDSHLSLLRDIALIINQFHSISASFKWSDHNFFLSYKGDLPLETICHNDIAPYNMVVKFPDVRGLIDYDTICPAPRIWDIVYVAYRFIGLGAQCLSYQNILSPMQLKELRVDQVKYLCDLTSISFSDTFFEILVERLESLCQLFDSEIEKENAVFIKMKSEGHYNLYLTEIEFITQTFLQ